MLNGLDLFSGIDGFSLALEPWVRTRAYCEINRHARQVLLDLMRRGLLPVAPIWNNLRTLRRKHLPFEPDAIYGGPPCQDFSVAGAARGLEGERGKLMFVTLDLIGDCLPRIVFLENVAALTVRGLDQVLLGLHALGYDARWTVVSAGEVGAPHLRERIWILAHANGRRIRHRRKWSASGNAEADHLAFYASKAIHSDAAGIRWREGRSESDSAWRAHIGRVSRPPSNSVREGLERWVDAKEAWESFTLGSGSGSGEWPSWLPQPAIRRGDDGISDRVDCLERLGNAIVPQCAYEAVTRLGGLK